MDPMQQDPMKEIDDKNQAARAEEISAVAPEASEPLKQSRLEILAKTVESAVEKLTDGQVDMPAVVLDGDQQQVPSSLFAPLMALASLASESGVPELEQYQFDPTQLSADNNGLVEMAGTIDAMANDKSVLKAMKGAAPAEPGAEEAVEDDAAEDKAEEASGKEDKDEDDFASLV